MMLILNFNSREESPDQLLGCPPLIQIFVTYHELYIVGCISSHCRPGKLHHGISTGFCSIYQGQVLACISRWC